MGGGDGECARRGALAPDGSSCYRNCRYANPQTDPPVSRPRGDHAERREAIARAAADAIATRGLEQVTLRDIAAALGVTTGVLTHYFPSKDALVAFTKAQAFNRHLARAREAAAGAVGVERLHAVVAELLPMDAERRTSWRLLVAFHGSAVGSAAMRRAHDRRMRAWFAFFAELVTPLGVADAEATGMAVALFVEGMAVHVAMMQPPRPAAWQRAFARAQVERLVSPTTPS
jgi:AcrR family transcriptional regulator